MIKSIVLRILPEEADLLKKIEGATITEIKLLEMVVDDIDTAYITIYYREKSKVSQAEIMSEHVINALRASSAKALKL